MSRKAELSTLPPIPKHKDEALKMYFDTISKVHSTDTEDSVNQVSFQNCLAYYAKMTIYL